jgi:hypothetical protein
VPYDVSLINRRTETVTKGFGRGFVVGVIFTALGVWSISTIWFSMVEARIREKVAGEVAYLRNELVIAQDDVDRLFAHSKAEEAAYRVLSQKYRALENVIKSAVEDSSDAVLSKDTFDKVVDSLLAPIDGKN